MKGFRDHVPNPGSGTGSEMAMTFGRVQKEIKGMMGRKTSWVNAKMANAEVRTGASKKEGRG